MANIAWLRDLDKNSGSIKKKQWQKNRAKKVHVRQWIQSQPTGIFGGRVAQTISRPAVGVLVNNRRRHDNEEKKYECSSFHR